MISVLKTPNGWTATSSPGMIASRRKAYGLPSGEGTNGQDPEITRRTAQPTPLRTNSASATDNPAPPKSIVTSLKGTARIARYSVPSGQYAVRIATAATAMAANGTSGLVR